MPLVISSPTHHHPPPLAATDKSPPMHFVSDPCRPGVNLPTPETENRLWGTLDDLIGLGNAASPPPAKRFVVVLDFDC